MFVLTWRISRTPTSYMATLDGGSESRAQAKKKRDNDSEARSAISLTVVGTVTVFLIFFAWHSTWVTSEAYSSPSIVLAANQHDGSRKIFDDFREAYYWLRQNTPEDAKVRGKICAVKDIYIACLSPNFHFCIVFVTRSCRGGIMDIKLQPWLIERF